jgi:hypothetical protein
MTGADQPSSDANAIDGARRYCGHLPCRKSTWSRVALEYGCDLPRGPNIRWPSDQPRPKLGDLGRQDRARAGSTRHGQCLSRDSPRQPSATPASDRRYHWRCVDRSQLGLWCTSQPGWRRPEAAAGRWSCGPRNALGQLVQLAGGSVFAGALSFAESSLSGCRNRPRTMIKSPYGPSQAVASASNFEEAQHLALGRPGPRARARSALPASRRACPA